MSTDKPQKAELDHIFIWTEPGGGSLAQKLTDLGIKESYRRQHIGQGTANICYCFENAFLELLWIENEADAMSIVSKRCNFLDRSKNGNPFGIAWRGDLAGIDTWDYKPLYLLEDQAIKVATASDNFVQPFMFTFSGFHKPHDDMVLAQNEAGFMRLEVACLDLNELITPSKALILLAQNGVIGQVSLGSTHTMTLHLKRTEDYAYDYKVLNVG